MVTACETNSNSPIFEKPKSYSGISGNSLQSAILMFAITSYENKISFQLFVSHYHSDSEAADLLYGKLGNFDSANTKLVKNASLFSVLSNQ